MSTHKFFFDEERPIESGGRKLDSTRISEILRIAIDSVDEEEVAEDLIKLRIKLKRLNK
jgi:hypothetical protein